MRRRQIEVEVRPEAAGRPLGVQIGPQPGAEAAGEPDGVVVGGVVGVDGLGAQHGVELDEARNGGVVLHDEREGVEQAALGDQRGAPSGLRLLAAGQDGLEDGVLRAEVVAQEGVADPDGLGDLPHGQVVEAPGGEDGHGLVDDGGPPPLAVGVAGAPVGRGDGAGRAAGGRMGAGRAGVGAVLVRHGLPPPPGVLGCDSEVSLPGEKGRRRLSK